VLATRRIGNNAAGLTTLLILLAEHAVTDADADAAGDAGAGVGEEFIAVDVAIETGRGLLVAAVRRGTSGVRDQPEGVEPVSGPARGCGQ
jgi:hypothetical protein